MSDESAKVTDAELAVLEFLWDHGETTIREITETLYPRGAGSDVATVQKLLHRLEAKGYIRRDRSPFAHRVQATISRPVFAGRQLRAMAQRLSAGSLTPLLVHLVEGDYLSPDERAKIRSLLDEHGAKHSSARSAKR